MKCCSVSLSSPGASPAECEAEASRELKLAPQQLELSLICALILVATACSHKTVVKHETIPSPPAVRAAMDRQITNAVDAGDGDYEIRELRKRIAAAPSDVNARLALAATFGARGFADLELEHYRVAVERFPDSDRAAVGLAKTLHRAEDDAEAIQILRGFCERHPDANADLFSWVGILADDAGDIAGAESWHRAAILRDADRDLYHNNLGYNLLLQGRFDDAVAEFRRALELNPKSDIARSNLGVVLAANPSEAVIQWQSISDPATAHNNLGAVLIERKRYAEARLEIERALQYSPGHPAARKNLELIAELDGKGTGAADRATRTGWQRFSAAFRKALGVEPPARVKGHEQPERPADKRAAN